MALSLAPISGRITLFGSTSLTLESGVGIPIIIEATGELKVVNYGKAGSTVTAFATETTGEQKVVNYGKDEASNLDAFRTDPNRILWSRPYEQLVQLDNTAVPSSDGILLDGSVVLAATAVYEIEFEVMNVDGTNAVSVDVYVDIAAGGSASAPEYIMQDWTIPAGGSSGVIRLTIASDDDIRGVAGAADDANIRWIKVKRVDNGA